MDNSYVEVLEGLYTSIFKDVGASFPNDQKGLDSDLSRLLSLVQTRGLSFYTIDLPSVGKIFDRSLADGLLPPITLPGFGKRIRGGTVPIFLSGLFLRVFEPSGVLKEQPDITAIFFLRQLFYAAKKLRITCDERRTSEAVSEFFRIEAEMRFPSLQWEEDTLCTDMVSSLSIRDCLHYQLLREHEAPNWQLDLPFSSLDEGPGRPVSPALLDTIQQVADIVSSSLGWFDPLEWDTKHGPGAVSDLRGGESKYSFPHWPEKLESFAPLADFAFANYSIWANTVIENGGVLPGFSRHEPPAKLIAVPKTQKSPRLIASEPTAHQWIQQSLNQFLRSATGKSSISKSVHFRDQTENQVFALNASATGSHATIDLSSASDRMSLWVVERMFRRNLRLLQALHACRTRWLINTIDKKSPKYIILKKLAAQGAAFTFPTQTIIYTCISIGAMLHHLGLNVTVENVTSMSREVRVYGDDIVVPIGCWETTANALSALGFEVNHSKTYGIGRFRESCGLDAYDGVEVTPAYYLQAADESRPASIPSVVECSNNFYKKGLWHSAQWVISTLPEWVQKNLPLVSIESGSFGIDSFQGPKLDHLKGRFNKDSQKEEVRCCVLSARVRRTPSHWGENLLQYFTEAPNPDDFVVWSAGVDSLPKLRLQLRWVAKELI